MHLLLLIFSGLKTLFRHLYLSISSIDFYKDVYKKYHGYGIRYLFTVSFIPAIIYCIFMLNYLVTLKDYFNGVQKTKVTDNIEYVLNQLPEMKYANSKISVEEIEPVYIYNKNNDKVAVIDTQNQVPSKEKSKIPFVIEKDKLIINFVIDNTKISFSRTINFNRLFEQIGGYYVLLIPNPHEVILTPEIIKKYFADISIYAPNLFIYLGMPAIILFCFIRFLLEKSILILSVYIVANLLSNKTSIKTSMRLVMFSSGIPILLQPLIILVPALVGILQIVQIVTIGLIFAAIWQINKNREFSSYL